MSEKEKSKASLLARWKNKKKQERELTNTISKVPEGINIPLSYGQKRLWFLQQMYPDNPFYNYSEVYIIEGELNTTILKQALFKVYNKHDILKSTYHDKNGKIHQSINKDLSFEVNEHNLTKVDDAASEVKSKNILEKNAKQWFNLEEGPLLHVSIIKLTANRHFLQITMHHIITDEWSMMIFRKQLSEYYIKLLAGDDISAEKRNIQFTDYAYWESKNSLKPSSVEYWKNKLSGDIPLLDLPTDYKRPLQSKFKGKLSEKQSFSKQFSQKFFDLANKLGTTPYVLMLSAYYVLLHKCSGQEDILIGTPITNRDKTTLENVFGFFLNTIVLRVKLKPTTTFKDLVDNVKKTTLEAIEHKNMPFSELVKVLKVERSLSTNPFFRVMFVYNQPLKMPSFGDNLKVKHKFLDPEVSKFDVTLFVSEEDSTLSTRFEYSTELFKTATVNRLQNYFKNIVESIVNQPELKVQNISMLTKDEMDMFLGNTKIYKNHFKKFNGIHEVIEQYAQSTPNAKSVTFKDESISYKALNERANNVASQIVKLTKGKNVTVGLCIERSLEMIIGMLGVLKAGCAYLPIDIEYPKERIAFMLEDSGASVILTNTATALSFKNYSENIINVDEIKNDHNLKTLELPISNPENTAYVIYTSGSTGKPKGVPISHTNILNSTNGRLNYYEENPSSFLLMSSISFDSSKAGIFWTLCTGGTLVITEKRIEQDLDKLANCIASNNVSHTLMLPSLYKLLLDYAETDTLESLKTVIVAGEACTASVCNRHFEKLPKVNLYNEYGPTEATVWCIAHKIEKDSYIANSIPIGKPVCDAQVYLLDNELNLLPLGRTGEIYVGGDNLTAGYINRPELNKNCFVDNPFKPGKKLYKTGDLAKYSTKGNLLFLGRADEQIKIRGYRVELTEIEKAISSFSKEIEVAHVLVDTGEENINLEQYNEETPSGEELLQMLSKINKVEVEEMIASVKALSKNQKEHLLNRL